MSSQTQALQFLLFQRLLNPSQFHLYLHLLPQLVHKMSGQFPPYQVLQDQDNLYTKMFP